MTSSGQPKVETSAGTPPAEILASAGWREVLCWLMGRRRRIRVSGRSMLPLLDCDSDVLMAPGVQTTTGDIVVARHPFKTDVIMVKYLAGYDQDGRACLHGLNPSESSDSRTLGAVPVHLILGKVTCRL